MKRRIAAILCAAALMLTLAACGTDTSSSGNASSGNAYVSGGNYNGYTSSGNAG